MGCSLRKWMSKKIKKYVQKNLPLYFYTCSERYSHWPLACQLRLQVLPMNSLTSLDLYEKSRVCVSLRYLCLAWLISVADSTGCRTSYRILVAHHRLKFALWLVLLITLVDIYDALSVESYPSVWCITFAHCTLTLWLIYVRKTFSKKNKRLINSQRSCTRWFLVVPFTRFSWVLTVWTWWLASSNIIKTNGDRVYVISDE